MGREYNNQPPPLAPPPAVLRSPPIRFSQSHRTAFHYSSTLHLTSIPPHQHHATDQRPADQHQRFKLCDGALCAVASVG
eukprot:2478768-Prymnesium_polylepis.1